MLDSCKMLQKQSEAFLYVSEGFFPSLKQNFISYRSSKVSSHPNCIFEIHLLWQLGFSRVYSNCWCSCSFEAEILKIGQSSHKMYSNNIVNFQESTTILNAHTKKIWKLIVCTSYIMMNSSVDLDIWLPISSVKDMHCWTTNTGDLSITVKINLYNY